MITGLHHVAIAVREFDAAVDGYRRLLAREPALQAGGGARRAWFHLANTSLEVISPEGDGHPGAPVAQFMDEAGEGMWLAAFGVSDVAAATRLFERRGLQAEAMGELTRVHIAGLRFVLWPQGERPLSAPLAPEPEAVGAMDHFVIQTPDAERAVANYAGRLGLDLRLDRANPRFGVRQLWFRCGDVVAEVATRLGAPAGEGPDRFGGLAWRVTDPDAAQSRLATAGFDVSEVREGRKPGTRVFTVRNAPGGVPTLMIQPSPALEAA
jgi:catechol 2,3-dioxygenase-like lactoylglutathione lyase family enzyme